MPKNSKGLEFNQAAADLIFAQLAEQKRILKIDHRGSWTNDDDLLMRDAAELLAGFGIASLYDLTPVYRELVYSIQQTQDEYGNVQQSFVVDQNGEEIRQATPEDIRQFNAAGRIVIPELSDTINKKTGRSVPLNDLNNSRGDGFTWYTINFHGGIPVMVAWKEKTGLGALGQQIGKFLSSPGFQLFILALSFIPIAPGAGSVLANISNNIGTSAMGAVGLDAAANPLLTKIVGDAAIRTVAAGGDLEQAAKAIATGQATGFVGAEVTSVASDIGNLSPDAAKLAGNVAATVVRAEITNGSIPAALAINVGADLITEGVKAVDIFGDNSAGTGLIYTPEPDLGFQAYGNVFGDITETSSIGVEAINYWDIGTTNDGTMIGISLNGTVLAETPDGKNYDVTSIWDKLPSVDDLNKTLKGLTQLAITGTTLTNIIEGKPVPGARPPAGTTVRNADGSTTTYNANGTVTRRLADGRVINTTTNAAQQAQMQNLTPLLAIGGIGLLLAS